MDKIIIEDACQWDYNAIDKILSQVGASVYLENGAQKSDSEIIQTIANMWDKLGGVN